ncbi:MAG: DUF72 domain-containing protein [Thaumarchaeota archaeon]|nr:DUF72 domain-containing protein [Candidatus Calditenuaceae archaeon]MDW8187120.1 DUF72 domain-containing protein [Nitrososphaerota archaeon]
MRVTVGCCGYTVSRKLYYQKLAAVEVQTTFYRVVRESTLLKWRSEAPESFTFTLKAFQGVTHPRESPTWRRSNVRPSEGHGLLRLTEEVRDSWRVTMNACRALSAKVVVVQTPPAFKDSSINIETAKKFFSSVERDDVIIGFEPRGWSAESIKEVCEDTDVTHVTDLFVSLPVCVSTSSVAYFRLHGSPPGKRLYKYTYTDRDLFELAARLKEVNSRWAIVMFNNVTMFDDASRFVGVLQSMGCDVDQSMSK